MNAISIAGTDDSMHKVGKRFTTRAYILEDAGAVAVGISRISLFVSRGAVDLGPFVSVDFTCDRYDRYHIAFCLHG